ncbi:Gfo/Idh/MocA family protein [Sphingomonas sp. DT-204]|uniref:Gfo/Idh/MocA family protein n=1 Tax=Sphingomonas sp. DT-204 TaxID=3396166 RepID=UPI003F1BD92F
MTPRIGFLGTGWIGRHRMAAMLATGAVEAAAVCDPSPECVAEALKLAPDARQAGSLAEMLALGLDGVVIATPSALHAEQAVAALDAGAAVFCQKPLGRTAAEAHRVVEAARAADRLLGIDLSYRHTAAMQAIVPLVQSGGLGRLFAIDLTFHNAYGPDKPWFYDRTLSGGGCVIDLGVHLVDLALWTLGFPPVAAVEADLRKAGAPAGAEEVEDFAVASFLAGEVSVRLACSWRLHAGRDAVIEAAFYGTEGGAALRNVDGSFYDFVADRFAGTGTERLADPPDDWGARAAAAWATQLAASPRFDPAAERFTASAEVLDRIYTAGLIQEARAA